MKIEKSWTYAAATDRVFEMIGTQDFQATKASATSTGDYAAEVTPADDGCTVLVRRTLPTDNFPDALRNAVGKTLTVVETQKWGPADGAGVRTADLDVRVEGAPVGLKGTVRLSPDGTGSTVSMRGDLKARIPLFGGKIEQAAAPFFKDAIAAEERAGRDWLASH
ncbi:DUF2505 domain-containing protein [Calidifontibacter sp. DB0510]|uniref:DUF2505 domain-containing protein n=1 Tax=Metallococcus carri TaxID=1656884 RepID=A0A967AY21_9MICO|nr:DUF2505 domain-containing protein [Metallococcus carri]NHN54534.1 DUF2505 domain-containing protein [Metallococcus carri]NOP36627.1 DUF2505 domain-containing protein [Calidifontibacter sp. DB2511S]